MPRQGKKKLTNKSDDKKQVVSVVENYEIEVQMHIQELQSSSDAIISSLRKAMQNKLLVTKDIAKMTVHEYVEKLMSSTALSLHSKENYSDADFDNVFIKPLQVPFPSGTVVATSTSYRKGQRTSKATRKKATLSVRRSSRKKMKSITNTPLTSSASFNNMKVVQGTPMFSRNDVRQLSVNTEPRPMKPSDKIGAFKLTMFSHTGSPLKVDSINDEMTAKLQESLRLLMQ